MGSGEGGFPQTLFAILVHSGRLPTCQEGHGPSRPPLDPPVVQSYKRTNLTHSEYKYISSIQGTVRSLRSQTQKPT